MPGERVFVKYIMWGKGHTELFVLLARDFFHRLLISVTYGPLYCVPVVSEIKPIELNCNDGNHNILFLSRLYCLENMVWSTPS